MIGEPVTPTAKEHITLEIGIHELRRLLTAWVMLLTEV
jgi:hypothetical protein